MVEGENSPLQTNLCPSFLNSPLPRKLTFDLLPHPLQTDL